VDAVQVDLWSQRSGKIVGAIITPRWDGVNAQLSIEAPDLELTLHADGPDLFAALQELRKTLEPLGWFPLCNGARVDCYPSGMARDMGGGAGVYVLSAKRHLRRRLPLVGTFEPALKEESVGTVDDQDACFRTWLESRRR
jgi:hypothetical protein